MVHVKVFPENIPFSGNAIFWKGKCIQVFGCLEIRFTENQFMCLVRTNILRKMTSVLQKINSHIWFGQTFYEKWNSFFTENQFSCLVCGSFYGKYKMPYNFKHLHYLNKPVTVQKYSSTSISKIIIQIQASALPRHICNSTKIFIHFNIKNNHLNVPIDRKSVV